MSRSSATQGEEDRPADAGRSPISANDPRLDWPITDDAIRDVFESMLRDGSWGRYHGPHCDALRQVLAEFFQVHHVHLCSSGTAAVELALRSVPVRSGDEVILCAYDFQSNFRNILTLDARPVLVDCEAGRPVIDVDELVAAVTDATRAIIVSHLHGCLVDVDRVRATIGDRPIAIIEDACQVPGAFVNGRRAGSLGDVGVLSFGGSKLLTAGRGGAVLTDDSQRLQRIVLHTQRGNDVSPLSEMQAAVLRPQLDSLDARNQVRSQAASAFTESVQQTGSRIRAVSDAPRLNDGGNSPVYYKLAMELDPSVATNRSTIAAAALEQGLLFDTAFPALHRIHGRNRFRAAGDLPNATRFHESLMVLHHTLLTSTRMTAVELGGQIAALCNGEFKELRHRQSE